MSAHVHAAKGGGQCNGASKSFDQPNAYETSVEQNVLNTETGAQAQF